ncbi:hypothetical protein GmHk_12G034758 [Glycine max]|nr:hypothetical protein GmHk_12G034758 [Glycine max]
MQVETIEHVDRVQAVQEVKPVEHVQPTDQQEPKTNVVFSGGIEDTSLLTSYADHVAWEVWGCMECGELKLVAHGRKLQSQIVLHD